VKWDFARYSATHKQHQLAAAGFAFQIMPS